MALVVAPCGSAGAGLALASLSLKVGGPVDMETAPIQAWLIPTAVVTIGVAATAYALVVLCPANATPDDEFDRTRARPKRLDRISAGLSFVAFESAIVVAVASAPDNAYKDRAVFMAVLVGVVSPILGWYADRPARRF